MPTFAIKAPMTPGPGKRSDSTFTYQISISIITEQIIMLSSDIIESYRTLIITLDILASPGG